VIDLHMHSNFSDGSETPTALAHLARAARLDAVALTDHDTTSGYDEMAAACAELDIELVAGTEVSVKDSAFHKPDGGAVGAHVLVYFAELETASPLQVLLRQLRGDRDARNKKLVNLLQEHGFTRLTYEYVVSLAKSAYSVGRPHFAQAMHTLHAELVGEKNGPNTQRIFDEWLGATGKAYIPKTDVTLEDLVAATAGTGALLSVAHPLLNYLGGNADIATIQSNLPPVIRSLRDRGVAGVESYYGSTPQHIRDLVVRLVRDEGVIPTGGSDFHGAYKPDVKLGVGRTGDLAVPRTVLDELRAESQRQRSVTEN
jgi:predicted metal-dependent phosphoesterase TrpH